MLSVAADDQCGNDRVVVAHFNRYDLRLDRAPRPDRASKDVVNLLFGFLDAEGEITRRAVKPLAREQPDYGVIRWSIEVTRQNNGELRIGKMVIDELSLGSTAHAVERLEMSASKHDGIAVRQDKGALEQASLLHAGDGMRQLDVVHFDKLMPGEQTDAVMAPTELDGGPIQPFHAAIESQLGDKVAIVLMRTIGAMGILIHFLQSHEIGLVLLDEMPDLLQAGITTGVEIEGHDLDGIVMTLGKGHTGQQAC